MNYLKQTIAQMHEQPLATWLTVAGTAISLFLVMAVFIMNNVKQVRSPR